MPNEYVQAIESVKEMEAFAAVIYSSNFEFEAEGSEPSFQRDDRDEAKAGEGIVEGGTAPMVGERRGVIDGIKSATGSIWGTVTG